jgi:hypothetical protein
MFPAGRRSEKESGPSDVPASYPSLAVQEGIHYPEPQLVFVKGSDDGPEHCIFSQKALCFYTITLLVVVSVMKFPQQIIPQR